MICYACKTTLVPLEDRPNLFFLNDEEVEPVRLESCPGCGREYSIHDKEAGMTIIELPQLRA